MKNNNTRSRQNTSEVNYWQSYSDMMSSLLMLFILLVLSLAYINQQTLEHKQAEIEAIYKESSNKIKEITKTKQYIITQLLNEINQDELDITIDNESGAISFNSNLLFDFNSAELKSEGKLIINRFLPKYVEILFREGNIEYIDEITIVGHTDTIGGYEYNLELSQLRALSVVNYIVVENGANLDSETLEKLKYYIGANGKSFSRPVTENGYVIDDKSRRVEFTFNIKDSTLTGNIEEILKDTEYN